MNNKWKVTLAIIATILCVVAMGAGLRKSDQPVVMSECKGKPVEVTFRIPLADALTTLGFEVESALVKDTGSAVIYIPALDVYYVTKRDKPSMRYDGEIFTYIKSECLE